MRGSESGAHSGRVAADSDGRGASFIPTEPFKPGEKVTVRTGLDVVGGRHGTFTFTVATPAGRIRAGSPKPDPRVRGDVDRFASSRALVPAARRIVKQPTHAAPGDLFVAPQAGPVQDGPTILGPHGGLIWFHPLPRGQSATDFRVQTYQRRRVLTWWRGIVSAAGVGSGQDEIYDTSYRPVATVTAGNGLHSDLHEFKLTSGSTALVTAYYPVYRNRRITRCTATRPRSSAPSGRSCSTRSCRRSTSAPGWCCFSGTASITFRSPTAISRPRPIQGTHTTTFHINSIQPLADGSLVISARDTWTAYDISHKTGAILWRLGGMRSSFRMGRGTSFAFQHSRVSVYLDRIADHHPGGRGARQAVQHDRLRELEWRHPRVGMAGSGRSRPGCAEAGPGSWPQRV